MRSAPSDRFSAEDAIISPSTKREVQMPPGSARRSIFRRKFPCTRSRLGCSARMKDGAPMVSVEISVS